MDELRAAPRPVRHRMHRARRRPGAEPQRLGAAIRWRGRAHVPDPCVRSRPEGRRTYRRPRRRGRELMKMRKVGIALLASALVLVAAVYGGRDSLLSPGPA